MNEFKRFHPCVNFVYFTSAIVFTVILMNPIYLAVSFISGFLYSIMLLGIKKLKTNVVCIIPLMILTAVINPIFNHEGITILAYFPSGNPLTLESVLYGICASVMIFGVICHFSCFNAVMTSDKLMCVFGNIIPSISLMFSMILRFVPKFKYEFKKLLKADKCLNGNTDKYGFIKKIKRYIGIFSIMITYSLENSIETSDSMKCRGYGCAKRTSYTNYIFEKRDFIVLVMVVIFDIYVTIGIFFKSTYCRFFPSFKTAEITVYSFSLILVFICLCFLPPIIEIVEAIRWKRLKSKI